MIGSVVTSTTPFFRLLTDEIHGLGALFYPVLIITLKEKEAITYYIREACQT